MEVKTSIATKSLSDCITFRGDEQSPLLAPRGCFAVNNMLFVADTAQNRVFIWKSMPESPFASPDIVLGQDSASSTGRNSDLGVNASSLFYPSGIWSDGQRLIVADAWNHRVLIWNEIKDEHGQSADVVVGQFDFESNQPNIHGVGSNPDAHTLYWPYGVHSDGKSLWIADTGNRRVLYYESIPTQNGQAANNVMGKPSFTERDYDHHDPIWPYSVKISPRGAMAITDTQYYRVLFWNNWKDALTRKADVVIGQADLDSNGQNQYNLFPKSNTLNWCYDTCFYNDGLWVADTGNSRLLHFPELPSDSNSPAAGLFGQDNFNTGSENSSTIQGTEKTLYWPFQICIDGKTMVIADTGNHRIVINRMDD